MTIVVIHYEYYSSWKHTYVSMWNYLEFRIPIEKLNKRRSHFMRAIVIVCDVILNYQNFVTRKGNKQRHFSLKNLELIKRITQFHIRDQRKWTSNHSRRRSSMPPFTRQCRTWRGKLLISVWQKRSRSAFTNAGCHTRRCICQKSSYNARRSYSSPCPCAVCSIVGTSYASALKPP